jgi:hypothetical protein
MGGVARVNLRRSLEWGCGNRRRGMRRATESERALIFASLVAPMVQWNTRSASGTIKKLSPIRLNGYGQFWDQYQGLRSTEWIGGLVGKMGCWHLSDIPTTR